MTKIKKSLLISSLIIGSLVSSSFMFSLVKPAHAEDYLKWGFESNIATSGTGDLNISYDYTTNDNNIITLGGAFLSNPNTDLNVFDSNLSIINSTLESGGAIFLYGGLAHDELGSYTLTNNTVTLSGTTIKESNLTNFNSTFIYGAQAIAIGSHTVADNTISITKSDLTSDDISIIAGRASDTGIQNINENSHEVTNNSISIADSTLNSYGNASFYGGQTEGFGNHEVTNNSVFIADSTYSDMSVLPITAKSMTIAGGVVNGTGTGNHEVTHNSVSITDFTFKSTVTPDYDILIAGGMIEGTGDQIITHNNVFITDSTLTAAGGNTNIKIVGGMIDGTGDHTITNNRVILSGTVNITAKNILLAGSITSGGGTGDIRSGNTLILDNATVNLTGTSTIENFENYAFNTSYEQIMANTTRLTADTINLGANANLTMGIWAETSTPIIPLNQEFTLMEATTTESGNFVNLENSQLYQGISRAYDVTSTWENRKLTGKITSTLKAVEQAKVPIETQAASIAVLNQGADILSSAGIKNALQSFENTDEQVENSTSSSSDKSSWAPFAAVAAKSTHEKTSYADMVSVLLLAGGARRTNILSDNDLLYGIFFECGIADIDTHNAFTNHTVDTNGNSIYYGGGVFAHFNHSSNLYGEASLRLGLNKIEQSSTSYGGFVGQKIDYNTSSMYYGAHLGTGYLWKISNKNSLDIYGKYFWTHQGGDSANIAGDEFTFEGINSQRARLGARYSYAATRIFNALYVGIAWEHEFGGDAEYSVHNLTPGMLNLEGRTNIIEIGVISIKTSASSPLSFDFGLEGYWGTREGFSGKLQVVYDF